MRPTDLRGILQYVPRFREKTFVVAVDGAAVSDENFVNILTDVAVLWSLSIRTVLVHGASVQIKALAEQRGVQPSDLEGWGVTDAATLKLALTAANRLTHEVLEGLQAADLRAASTNAVLRQKLSWQVFINSRKKPLPGLMLFLKIPLPKSGGWRHWSQNM